MKGENRSWMGIWAIGLVAKEGKGYLPLVFPQYFSSSGNPNSACRGIGLLASWNAVSRGTPKSYNGVSQGVTWGTLLYLKHGIVLIALPVKRLGSIWGPGHSWGLRCRATAAGRLLPEHPWAAAPAAVATSTSHELGTDSSSLWTSQTCAAGWESQSPGRAGEAAPSSAQGAWINCADLRGQMFKTAHMHRGPHRAARILSLATCQLVELLRASLRMWGAGAFCVIWHVLLPGLHKTTYQSWVHCAKILTLYFYL